MSVLNRLLDNLSSKRDRHRVYGLAYLLDSSLSNWDKDHSLIEQIIAIIVRAILISLPPRYFKGENRRLETSELS